MNIRQSVIQPIRSKSVLKEKKKQNHKTPVTNNILSIFFFINFSHFYGDDYEDLPQACINLKKKKLAKGNKIWTNQSWNHWFLLQITTREFYGFYFFILFYLSPSFVVSSYYNFRYGSKIEELNFDERNETYRQIKVQMLVKRQKLKKIQMSNSLCYHEPRLTITYLRVSTYNRIRMHFFFFTISVHTYIFIACLYFWGICTSNTTEANKIMKHVVNVKLIRRLYGEYLG